MVHRDIARCNIASLAQKLQRLPASLRAQMELPGKRARPVWKHVLQFRPSGGLRVKRYTSCPALVAMTTTQIPILGPKRRFIAELKAYVYKGFGTDISYQPPRKGLHRPRQRRPSAS